MKDPLPFWQVVDYLHQVMILRYILFPEFSEAIAVNSLRNSESSQGQIERVPGKSGFCKDPI